MRAASVEEAVHNLQTVLGLAELPGLADETLALLRSASSITEFENIARRVGVHGTVIIAAVDGRTDDASIHIVRSVVFDPVASARVGSEPLDPFTERPVAPVDDTTTGDASVLERIGRERQDLDIRAAQEEGLRDIARETAGWWYDEESDTFWKEIVEGHGFARAVDMDATDLLGWFANEEGAFLQFQQDDTGGDLTRQFETSLFEPVLPDTPRTQDFIRGIPADFLSNRRVVEGSQRFVDAVYRLQATEGSPGNRLSLEEAAAIVKREHPGIDGVVRFATPVNEENDALTLFAGKDPSVIREWQDALVRGGYLTHQQMLSERGYVVGNTLSAFNEALFDSATNGFGGDQNGGLTRWLQNRAASLESLTDDELASLAGRGPFVSPTFVKPDFDTLTNAVKSLMEQKLGRRPTDTELKLLADGLGSDFRREHAVQIEAQRRQYDAENRWIVFGDETPQGGGSVQGVNPLDSLLARIEDQFEGEIHTNQRVDELQANNARFMQILSGFEQAVT